MPSWIVVGAFGLLMLTAYMIGRIDGRNDAVKDAFTQHKKDSKKLKEVADEADHDIANGDTDDKLRIFGWFRK